MELFEGEKFINKKTEIEKTENTDEQTNKKYDSGEVRIVTEQARYPLPTLKAYAMKIINLQINGKDVEECSNEILI